MEHQKTQEWQTSADEEYTNAIINRLVEHYLARRPMPGKEGEPLSIERFHRLYCAIMAEGYGK